MQTTTLANLSFVIRIGEESDAEFFFQLEEQTTWENLPRDDASRYDRHQLRSALCQTHAMMLQMPGNVFFIAEDEHSGQRAGLLWFAPKRNLITGEDEGWIYNVTVCEPFRGRGLAKQLLRRAEGHAMAAGYRVIGLAVAVHNDVARELYRAMGYSQSNILMRKPIASQSTLNEDDCPICDDDTP